MGASSIHERIGTKVATLVIFFDLLKGFVFGLLLITSIPYGKEFFNICAICVILGHIFPFQKKNTGGRGVLISAGILLSIIPISMTIGSIFIVSYKLIYKDSAPAVILSMPIILVFAYIAPSNKLFFSPIEELLFIYIPIILILIVKRIWPYGFMEKHLSKKIIYNRLLLDRDEMEH
jgi:glycerol-3-phosphate acyltransferase PlsY